MLSTPLADGARVLRQTWSLVDGNLVVTLAEINQATGAVLREARRVLKPGGRFFCLEFSRLAVGGLEPAYDFYSFNAIPALGKLLANDADSYRYLVESIRRFPDQEAFLGMIREAGFTRAAYHNMAGGVCALHWAWSV